MTGDGPQPGRAVDTVGAILWRDRTVLLGLRSPRRRSYPYCWDVIGGHVEPGETLHGALARELREEIGITAPEVTSLGDVAYPGRDDRTIWLRLYRVDRWAGEPRLANDEHVGLRWFDPAEAARLPTLALESYRPFLAALSR